MAQHTVNCPWDGCDFPIDTDGLDDGDQFECPECGEFVEVTNDGTKLIAIDPEDADPLENTETDPNDERDF